MFLTVTAPTVFGLFTQSLDSQRYSDVDFSSRILRQQVTVIFSSFYRYMFLWNAIIEMRNVRVCIFVTYWRPFVA